MIERVYWIGAGASVPYGLPTLKQLTWQLGSSLDGEDREIFFKAVHDCFSVPLSKEDCPVFEELLNRLNPEVLSYLEDPRFGKSRSRAWNIALTGLGKFCPRQIFSGRKRSL